MMSNSPRACKVIVTYFGPRRLHGSNSPEDAEESLKVLQYHVNKEKTLDHGTKTDLIIIHHENEDSPCELGRAYIQYINGQTLKNGTIKTHSVPNEGAAFGGYALAHSIYKNEYDLWHFAEDDVMIIVDNTFKRAWDQFSNNPNLSFISLAPPTRSNKHAPGGCGWSISKFMDARFNEPDIKEQFFKPINATNMLDAQKLEEQFTYPLSKRGFAIENLKDASPFPINVHKHEHLNRRKKEMGGEKSDNGNYIYMVGL